MSTELSKPSPSRSKADRSDVVGPEQSAVTGAEFEVLSADNPDEFRRWAQAWERIGAEPHAHPAYCVATRTPEAQPHCAIAHQDTGEALIAFDLREVPGQSRFRDAETPYGYGGCYFSGTVDLSRFWESWDNWAQESDIVGLKVKRHLIAAETLEVDGLRFNPQDHIVIPLDQSADSLWGSFQTRARSDIRAGRRNGVEVVLDTGCQRLKDFHDAYWQNMHRVHAKPYYFFTLDALAGLCSAMPDSVALFHALHDGTLLSSELILLGRNNAYLFLTGALPQARDLRANHLMQWETMKQLQDWGYRRYVIGGGMAKRDALFDYKRAFAPQGIFPLEVVYRESLPAAARQLARQRRDREPGWEPAQDFAPVYRAPNRQPMP